MTEQTTSGGRPEAQGKFPRGLELALCVAALAWVVAADLIAGRAAQGLVLRFQMGLYEALLERLFLVFLLVFGFRLLDWGAARGRFTADALPLPKRKTSLAEWGTGAAIGWGICVASVLPVLVSGHLLARLNWQAGSLLAVPLALISLLAGTLGQELIFRGFAFYRLQAVIGPSWASLLFSVAFALSLTYGRAPRNLGPALVSGLLLGLLLAMAYLRTNALWTGWGLHFAYRAIMAIVIGLPIAGRGEFGSVADTFMTGPRWLTGGAFGLDAAYLTVLVLLTGLSVLYAATREYAWEYTKPLILPAGYAVEIAPPVAHVAMEKAAAPPALVQILPAAPPPSQSVPRA